MRSACNRKCGGQLARSACHDSRSGGLLQPQGPVCTFKSCATKRRQMASKELEAHHKTLFEDGVMVICVCPNRTYLPCKPMIGDVALCACGNGYAQAKIARMALHKEEIEAEKKAIEGSKKNEEEKKDVMKADKAPSGISPAVWKTFKNTVLPAFEDPLGKAKWDTDVLGETVAEAMTIYNGYYGDFGSAADKKKELDVFRNKTANADIIEKLVERVKELNDA